MDILCKYESDVYGILTKEGAIFGDKVQVGINLKENTPIFKEVIQIIEQRLERGTYEDESRRKVWAKVRVQ